MQYQVAVNFLGRLVCDPELKDTRRGGKLCIMRLMFFSSARRGFINLVAFDADAEEYAERFSKGDLIEGNGELTYSEWTVTPSGRRREEKRHECSILLDEIDHAADTQ